MTFGLDQLLYILLYKLKITQVRLSLLFEQLKKESKVCPQSAGAYDDHTLKYINYLSKMYLTSSFI